MDQSLISDTEEDLRSYVPAPPSRPGDPLNIRNDNHVTRETGHGIYYQLLDSRFRQETSPELRIHPTARVRNDSDSCTPTQESSPFGSPRQKWEELDLGSAGKDHRRKDRRGGRDEFDVDTYEGRLNTFFPKWHHPILDKEVLAEAGFYYTGESEQVVCCKCERDLENWTPIDDPRNEHRQNFSYDCF